MLNKEKEILHKTQKAQPETERVESKIKNLCSSEDIKRVRKAIRWKASAKHVSNRGLVSRIYKELLQISKKKIGNPGEKQEKKKDLDIEQD